MFPLEGEPAHLQAGQPGALRAKEGEGGEGGEGGEEEEAGQESDLLPVRLPPHCFGENNTCSTFEIMMRLALLCPSPLTVVLCPS